MTEPRESQSAESRVDELVRDAYAAAMGLSWDLEPDDVLTGSSHPPRRRVSRRVGVLLVAAAVLLVFFVPFPHLSVFDRLSHQQGASSTSVPSTTPSTNHTKAKVVVVARLPKGDKFALSPALAGDGRKVVALLAPSTGVNGPRRLAQIAVPSGRLVLGPSVTGTAGVFSGGTGQVFLLSWSVGASGRLELSRVSGDLTPVPLVQFSFKVADVEQRIAVAAIPNEDEAWIADGGHIELVNLADGDLIASRLVSLDAEGPVDGLALASASGPLYATFCGRHAPNPGECGAIAGINPANGSVISKRYFEGVPGEVVATSSGAWLSSGEGGNGRWMDFFSSDGLRPTRVTVAFGWLELLASNGVVWGSLGPVGLSCFSASAAGSIHQAQAAASLNTLVNIGYPLGIEPNGDSILVATVNPYDVVAVPIPSACTRRPSTTPPASRSNSELSVLARLPKGFQFATSPVLTDRGHEVVALLESSNTQNPPLRLAKVELPSRRVVFGPRVAGKTAGVFTGPAGHVFLLTLSGGTIGHFELWRVPSDLKPVRLVRLPFTEATAEPAVAVAVVPEEDKAWIGDGAHLELVNLANGELVLSRPAPRNIKGNVMGLALASARGPLYTLYCERRHSPEPNPCGAIAEINPANGSVISQRWFEGVPWYPRSGIVATPAGVWLSSGGGGNGVWTDFLSSTGLRQTQLFVTIGHDDLFAAGGVAWDSWNMAGFISCLSVSASGSVRQTGVVSSMNETLGGTLPGYPFGIEAQRNALLVADEQGEVVSILIPKACGAHSG